MPDKNFSIERKIIIGLITSTDYLRQVRPIWNIRFIQSQTARMLASWCLEYFDKYDKAPFRDIDGIFRQKLKNGRINKETEQDIEDILESLSEQYEQEDVNIDYLLDQTKEYFNERNLLNYSDEIKGLVDSGELLEAEKLASDYKPIIKDTGSWVELSDSTVLEKVEKAFNKSNECLIEFPGALGQFMNDQLTRDALVAFMSTEKRGKTFWLLELAMRACKRKQKVAFFEAGDLSESQLLIRICINLAKKSNKKKYSGKMYVPVKDCILNQTDDCDKEERECDFGVFKNKIKRTEIEFEELKSLFEANKDYNTCANCKEFMYSKLGTPWLKIVNVGDPLTSEEAKQQITDFFIKHKRQFKISIHASGTLSIKQIYAILDIWEKQEGFVPSVIILDYPDIMTDDTKEFRHRQNKIWMDMRGLSEKKHCLVIPVTQTDADSYSKDLLKMNNFSEDKRKYGHVTAMYGLNQDHVGREKELGILRINEIVVRDGDFNNQRQVYVLQNLKRGQPFLTSYW